MLLVFRGIDSIESWWNWFSGDVEWVEKGFLWPEVGRTQSGHVQGKSVAVVKFNEIISKRCKERVKEWMDQLPSTLLIWVFSKGVCAWVELVFGEEEVGDVYLAGRATNWQKLMLYWHRKEVLVCMVLYDSQRAKFRVWSVLESVWTWAESGIRWWTGPWALIENS